MPGIIVDIGTGDGKFAYTLAKKHPDRFIIGIDPHHTSLEDTSAQIYKKPAKGGIKNALFVLANVTNLPEELNGVANQVFVNFPWSSLLKGIVQVDEQVWAGIKRICQPGAHVDLLFGYNAQHEQQAVGDLPVLSIRYFTEDMIPKLERIGFTCFEVRKVPTDELKTYPSTWGKKLLFGRDRTYYSVRLQLK